MGEQSAIGWTEATWNPWYGCKKISPGCKFCYMYREMQRYGRDPYKVQRSKTMFTAPLKWKGTQLVFTCSWSDFFIEAADAWRPEAWDIIKRTPHLTYQILTKRPELILDRLPADWGMGYPNVWLGVSVESPLYFGRIAYLQKVPAVVRFLSLEPILAAMAPVPLHSIDWGIVGGESGSDRDCQVRWITDLVEQFRAAHVPIFVKQDSGPKPGQQGRIPNSHWIHEFPRNLEAK